MDLQEEVRIEIDYWNFVPETYLATSIHLLDKMGVVALASSNMHSASLTRDEWFGKPHPTGLFRSTCTLPGDFLNEGLYTISAFVLANVNRIEASAREAVSFMVHDTGSMRKEFGGTWIGVVRPRLAWQTRCVEFLSSSLTTERSK